MDAKEIELFEKLKVEYQTKAVSKPTMSQLQPVFNRLSGENVKYCMCSKVQRTILARQFLDYYEGITR